MAYLLMSTVMLASLDSVAKVLGQGYAVSELVWARYAVHLLIVIAVFGPRRRMGLFRTASLGLQLSRSVLLLATTVLYFVSLQHLPLAETSAITFSAPILTLTLAPRVLRERVRTAQVMAALIGFVGVIAVIQPFTTSFSPAIAFPLGAAVCSSVYTVLTRLIGTRGEEVQSWLYTSVAGAVLMAGFAPFGWRTPDGIAWILFVLLGLFGGLGHLAIITGYARAPASLLAPLSYMELIWVTVIGFALFGEAPNLVALVGITAITLSCGFVAARGRA